MIGINPNFLETLASQALIKKCLLGSNNIVILAGVLAFSFLALARHDWVATLLSSISTLGYSLALTPTLTPVAGGLDWIGPLTCSALTYGAFVAFRKRQNQEKQRIKTAFQAYLSENVVEEILAKPDPLKLGGKIQNMSLLFADIRGFTPISEQFDAGELTAMINRFLTPMSDFILKRNGTIDKYMGDCIMAFWNAPQEDPYHASNACQAALEMKDYLVKWNRELWNESKATGKPFVPIHIGIGINTGNCFVGNIGSTRRFDYSVLGDDVNLASRLEGLTKIYGADIVMGQNAHEQAPDYATIELDLIRVKGKKKPVRIYALLGDQTLRHNSDFRVLRQCHEAMLTAYRARQWDTAMALIQECIKLDTPRTRLRTLYKLYVDRIQLFRAHPPAPDWDAVTQVTPTE